jgi:acyl-CoA dehydrogenase
MEFTLPPDTLMLRDMLRRFLQKEARPLEMKYFNSGELAPEERARLRQAIQQLGLWGLMVPEQFGGGGLDTLTACVIEEELGTTFVPVEMGEVPALLYACQGEQLSNYLEPALEALRRPVIAAREPGADGLQPSAWTTSARAEGEGYLLNGRKSLSALPSAEDFYIVLANAPQGLTAFLLEPDAHGLSASQNGNRVLVLEDCRAPGSALLGEPGGALELAAGEAPRAWIRTGARYVGMAERLLEMAGEHARDWVSLGAPLSIRPAVQRMLAESRVEIESVRWLVYHAAWLADTAGNDQLKSAAAQVRLGSGEMLKHTVDRTTMIFAGPGPIPQIEPRRLVKSLVPSDALDLALENARGFIAAELLHLPQE